MVKLLICIPTYNEVLNVEPLLRRVIATRDELLHKYSFLESIDVLIIDDNSPDGTEQKVRSLNLTNVDILHRSHKEGLGPAYIAGFRWGLERGFTHFVEMDADQSHQPEELARLVAEIPHGDLILGTRWMPGGRVVNWPLHRRVLSLLGTKYASLGLGLRYRDVTGGYRILGANLLEKVDLETLQTRGYGFQIEMVARAHQARFRIIEVPITFIDRTLGRSKMNARIALEAIGQITRWSVKRTFRAS